MKQSYISPYLRKHWIQAMIFATLLLLVHAARAQEGSQGNTTIFGGAQMTFFGNHDFVAGGSGAQPGIILTERAAGNFGILNFSGTNLTSSGASDAGHVDGYVRKYGTGQFIFPVGDNGFLGQFAASADGTMGAYFHVDPSVAITSNLFTGGNYPELPSGGLPAFPRTSKAATVGAVTPVEYWDIDGATATPVTLTWDAGSDIGTLTSTTLSRLTIVGWDVALAQWVRIPSTIDATSILGGSSNVASGSITTNASIIPNNYIVYAFGASAPDLTPIIALPSNNFSANGITRNFTVGLYELLSVATGENVIQFQVTVPTGYSLTFVPTQTSIVPSGGAPVAVKNSDWDNIASALGGRRLTFRAKPGVSIAALANSILGFSVTRVSAQSGSSSVITTNIINDASKYIYDSVDGNNIYSRVINAL
jgi:hypothetical protein